MPLPQEPGTRFAPAALRRRPRYCFAVAALPMAGAQSVDPGDIEDHAGREDPDDALDALRNLPTHDETRYGPRSAAIGWASKDRLPIQYRTGRRRHRRWRSGWTPRHRRAKEPLLGASAMLDPERDAISVAATLPRRARAAALRRARDAGRLGRPLPRALGRASRPRPFASPRAVRDGARQSARGTGRRRPRERLQIVARPRITGCRC